MSRRVFYSFHYDADNWRVQKIRNIGMIEGNQPCSPNDWESVKRGGAQAIENWIAAQMKGRSCTIVLIGTRTAERHWIKHEIGKSWNDGMGVLGIFIHRITDSNNRTTSQGANPFASFTLQDARKTPLSTVVRAYDPPGLTSADVYAHIAKNLTAWIDEAIAIRRSH